MKQMTTCLLTRVEEFTLSVDRMAMQAMAVRIIAPPRPPCANSVPMELLQQILQGLEFVRPEPPSLDRILLVYALRLIRNLPQSHTDIRHQVSLTNHEPIWLLSSACHWDSR